MAKALARRRVLSLTTWMYAPHVGAHTWEVLARASATPVVYAGGAPASSGGGSEDDDASNRPRNSRARHIASAPLRPRLHLLASQHVTHPFKFPGYYPAPQFGFLEHITADDTKHTVELREASINCERLPVRTCSRDDR
jgi:hypothetical protein